MSLISYIEKLRTKSESERKKISISIAFVVTGIIFIIWAFTVFSNISTRSSSLPVARPDDTESVYSDIKTSWNSLIDSVSDIFSGSVTVPTTTPDAPYFDALEGIPGGTVPTGTTSDSPETMISE